MIPQQMYLTTPVYYF